MTTYARVAATLSAVLSALVLLSITSAASAQVRYRRPFFGGRSVSAYFDHAGSGCRDWACGGVCYDGHTGTDYAMPVGTAVASGASGTVVTAFNGCSNYGYFRNPCGGRCGNHVIIAHSDGSRSTYCHMRNGSIRVRVGQSVACGQVIGESASSGSSTGPHLHFGHRSPGAGSPSDPYTGGCNGGTTRWASQGPYRGNPAESCPSTCSASSESCNNRDDDCDGRVDENLRRSCGSNVGVCSAGVQTCARGGWGGCSGAVGPSGETCDNRDQDCDGRTDENLRRGCGTNVGECVAGNQTCGRGSWGSCAGSVGPRTEDCDGRDEDCDGRTDESLMRMCGTDVGECVSGLETCRAASWGSCEGAVDPVPEVCDMRDNDCDGEDDDERICEREEVAWAGASYGGSRDSDASGDGRADACALTSGAFSCVVPSEHGFTRSLGGGELDADDLFTASVIRMGDLDGDGYADVCGRQGDRLACWRSNGSAFGEIVLGPEMLTLTHLALVDVDGDAQLDVCTRDATGVTCHLGHGNGFGGLVTLTALSDALGFADILHHGSLRFGDLNGDGRADVCARDAEGLGCWLSEGDHFGDRLQGPRWSDAEGYDALSRWSTLRLADVDGDGRDDACIRAMDGFTCVLASERGFGESVRGPSMDDPSYERSDVYATLRMADLTGDGLADVCVREPDGVRCWVSTGRDFDRRIEGPQLSDADGWTAAARYRSLRLADVSGDGRADLCAIAADGLRCWLASGGGFERTWLAMTLSDASLTTEAERSTLRIAGGGAVSTMTPAGCGCRAGQGPSPTWAVPLLGALALLLARRRL